MEGLAFERQTHEGRDGASPIVDGQDQTASVEAPCTVASVEITV